MSSTQPTYQFTSISIPAPIYCDKSLSPVEILLWSEICALSQSTPCIVRNSHFMERFNVCDRTIRRYLENLIKKGHLIREFVNERRHLFAIQPQSYAVQKSRFKEKFRADISVRGVGHSCPPYPYIQEEEINSVNCTDGKKVSACHSPKEGKKPRVRDQAEVEKSQELLHGLGADKNFCREMAERFSFDRIERNVEYVKSRRGKKKVKNPFAYLRVAIQDNLAANNTSRV